MYSQIAIATLKTKYNNNEWTREKIEEMATNMFNKELITQKDLDGLQEFFEPTVIENV